MAVVSAEPAAPVVRAKSKRAAQAVPKPPYQLAWGFTPVGWRGRAARAHQRRPPAATRAVHQAALVFERIAYISGCATISLKTRAVVPGRPGPIRPAALRPFIPRRKLPGARPKSLGTKPLAARTSLQVRTDLRELAALGYYVEVEGEFMPGLLYPQNYGDCEVLVPRKLENGARGWCPFIGCRNHLAYEVDPVTGALKEMFPGRELSDLEHTCVLRYVEEATDGGDLVDPERTLEAAGRVMNLTTESVRLTANAGMAKFKRRLPASVRTEEEEE